LIVEARPGQLRGHGPTEVTAVQLVAARIGEEVSLCLGGRAFGGDAHAQLVRPAMIVRLMAAPVMSVGRPRMKAWSILSLSIGNCFR
jgi:hypothetical protein